ncbi:response regulator [Labilithrix luteola]|uniref:Response regulator n=1 Tax=Labilithrix luteola TaxID=1391654 RepID=A0A0K1PU97_9BACT|nr:response regulator [Labilithrix luteola]AKU97113.1 response regulator [Labilithrix luteola]
MSGARPKVLIVDDDADLRELMRMILATEDLDVVDASNGAEALEAVVEHRPALVLLDMTMPVMDGWGFARNLASTGVPRPRIVVVTAAESAAQRAREVSADAWLAKPFEVDELVKCVRRFATRSE